MHKELYGVIYAEPCSLTHKILQRVSREVKVRYDLPFKVWAPISDVIYSHVGSNIDRIKVRGVRDGLIKSIH